MLFRMLLIWIFFNFSLPCGFLVRRELFHFESADLLPTSGRAVLPSKLVGGRIQVQSLVALVDLAVRNFPWRKYGLGFLRKILKKGTLAGLGG